MTQVRNSLFTKLQQSDEGGTIFIVAYEVEESLLTAVDHKSSPEMP